MTEKQIRNDIKQRLPYFFNGTSNAYIVEEMEICFGKARADIAVITDQLIGIEIKSRKDNLIRLPKQIIQYSKCFDRVVLVVHESHASEALQLIPEWWGFVIGFEKNGSSFYRIKRRPSQNKDVETAKILALLWREEIENLFIKFFSENGSSYSSKRKLRDRLIRDIPNSILKSAGIEALRKRTGWRLKLLKS